MGLSLNISAQNKAKVYGLQFQDGDQVPAEIKFYCAKSYPLDKCKEHAVVLRQVLKHHSLQALGPWSFILVPAGDWDDLLRLADGPAGSPAFSALHSRDTFVSESLFAPTRLQQAEQMQLFRMRGADLLELAVSHELGHALCNELNEFKANTCAIATHTLSTRR